MIHHLITLLIRFVEETNVAKHEVIKKEVNRKFAYYSCNSCYDNKSLGRSHSYIMVPKYVLSRCK